MRKKRRLILVLTALLCMSYAALAQEEDIALLNDEFDDAATLADWTQFHEMEDWPDMIGQVDIDTTRPGSLYLEPITSGWYADYHAPFMFKAVTGDFVVTARVRATGKEGELPTAAWSLAGLMARAPREITAETWEPNGEDWVFITTGIADRLNRPVFETKTTDDSVSRLELHPARAEWLELRMARIGANFLLLYRYEGETEWQLQERFFREDMPATLQVGLVAYTDWLTADHLDAATFNTTLITDGSPDLIFEVDYMRFARPVLPADYDGGSLRAARPADIFAMLPE